MPVAYIASAYQCRSVDYPSLVRGTIEVMGGLC